MFLLQRNERYLNHNSRTMKNLCTFLLFLTISGLGYGQAEDEVELKLTFEVTKHNKGNIFLAVYDSDNTHMKKTHKSGYGVVKDSEVVLLVKNLKKGTYSFSYFHDVNGNRKLDNNFLGIPKEPYGFANDQRGRFGPPSFKDAIIEIKKDTIINIKIK